MTGAPDKDERFLGLWAEHQRLEFSQTGTENIAALLATMTADAAVNHVPVITGGRGSAELQAFYSRHFQPCLPKDTAVVTVFRRAGSGRVVDEYVLSFTHDLAIDWLLPGVSPTDRQVRVPCVAVAEFDGDKIAHKRVYWDQATVLVQTGLLDPTALPVTGAEQAEKVLHPDSVPSNELIWRAHGGRKWDLPDYSIEGRTAAPTVPDPGALQQLWRKHLTHEFLTLDADATVATMVPHAHVNHVPTLTGGSGHEQLRYFYSNHFIGQGSSGLPEPAVCTIAGDTLIDELNGRSVHAVPNDYALPGVRATGRVYSRPAVIIVHFEGDKLAYEHLYWDQASTLYQLGLWDPGRLPVTGPEQADKLTSFDSVPSNELIRRALGRRAP